MYGKIQRMAWGWLALAPFTAALAQLPPPPPPQPLGSPPVPASNPLTTAKINLGMALFWDEQLSLSGTVACGSCHRPGSGGGDPRSAQPTLNPGADGVYATADDVHGSAGVPALSSDGLYRDVANFGVMAQVTARKAPSAVNSAYAPQLFWDGRAGGSFSDPDSAQLLIAGGGALENQSLGPLLNNGEMAWLGETTNDLATRVASLQPLQLADGVPSALSGWIAQRSYPALFAEAFGTADVGAARIALAIASYERTLNATQTPIDSEFGGTPTLTQLERQGQQVFLGNDCAGCHAGSLFSDNAYHYIGVRPANEDLGRFVVSANNADRGAFRTPSLRNVALRAPYMHDGRFATLEEVVDFYDRGGDFTAPNKDPRVHPRGLTPAQKTALLAFLRRPLTDARVAAETGPFARPRLYTESNRVPRIVGESVPGSNGLAPQIVALEPPFAGNHGFTVAVAQARANAGATLVVAHIDPGTTLDFPEGFVAAMPTTLDANGAGSVNLDLGDPALLGHTLYGRWYVNDDTALNSNAISQAFRIVVFDADSVFASDFE